MGLEQIFQQHEFGSRRLPPHRVCAALRLDGWLVKITSRTVFRDMGTSRTWLEDLVREAEGAHGAVRLERFRVIVDDEESLVEGEPIASAPWNELPAELSVIQDRIRARRAARDSASPNGSHDSSPVAARGTGLSAR